VKILAPTVQPLCRPIGRKLSTTLEEVEYRWIGDNGLEYRLIVPNNFIFDGASIPRLLWTATGLAPHGVMDGPALPHDFGYHYQGDFPAGSYQLKSLNGLWYDCAVPMQREQLDSLLHALCLHFGIGSYRAGLVWSGVRLGGWWAWLRDDDKRKLAIFDQVAADIQGETP